MSSPRARRTHLLLAHLLAAVLALGIAPAAAQPDTSPPAIVVLGGPAAVSADVAQDLAAFGPVTRLEGASRYDTAVAISQARHPDGAPVVFIATGQGFADALALGPVAARAGGPILLVPSASVPQAVADELRRLAPDQIVIAGGLAVISDDVADELATVAPVRRLAGEDRFATAAVLAAESHPTGADSVVIARADDFADALAAGPAATASNAPILLTHRSRLPEATVQAIADLGAESAIIAGGEAAVPAPIAEALAQLVPVVNRVDGPTRFATAAAFAARTFQPGEPDTIFVASGRDHPDALAGSAAAAGTPGGAFNQPITPTGPILLTEPDRLPDETLEILEQLTEDPGIGVAENGAPTAADVAATTNVDQIVSIPLVGADPDGDPLSYTITSAPSSGSVTLSGSTATYTPGSVLGPITFTYVVDDGIDTSAPATVTVTVNPSDEVVNQPPTADDQAITTDEDTPVTFTPTVADPDGTTPTLAIATPPAEGTAVVGPGAGELTYTPAPDAVAPVTFTYIASDASLSSAPATVTVTITPVNDAPVAPDQVLTTPEDTVLNATATATDVDSAALTFSLLTPPDPAAGTATVAGDGTVAFTPAPNAVGPASLTFEVTDGALTDTGTIDITIDPVNDPPVLSPPAVQPFPVVEDTPTTISLPLSDVDDVPAALTVSVVAPPGNGTLTPGATPGVLTYTPDPDVDTTDTFTAQAQDDDGATSPIITVDIDLTGTPDAPVASPLSFTIAEDAAASTQTFSGTDVDGDALTFTTGPTTPTLGSLGAFTSTSATSATADYTPTLNANGTDSFEFTVEDPGGLTGSAAVTVTITPVNDAPTAIDKTYTYAMNTALSAGGPAAPPDITTTSATTLLAGAADLDGDAVEAVPATAATTAGGAVEVFADGSFIYDPPAGHTASDTFTYEVTDGVGGTSPAATVTLNPVAGVWYVDTSAAAGGDGTSDAPFQTLAEAQAQATTGQRIYVRTGTYAESLALLDDQDLHGEGAALQLDGQAVLPAGTNPTVGDPAGAGITLAMGNTIRGLDIAAGGTALSGTGFGTVALDVGDVMGTTPLSLDTGTVAAASTIGSLQAMGATGGIDLTSVSGAFAVTTTTVTDTVNGIRVQGASTVAMDLGIASITSGEATSEGLVLVSTAGATVSVLSLLVDVDATGIWADGEGLSTTMPISVSSVTGPALSLRNLSDEGPLTFASVTVTNGTTDGILLEGNAPALSFLGLVQVTALGQQGITITGGSASVSFADPVTVDAGGGLSVTTRPLGTTTFSGGLTVTSSAVTGIALTSAGAVEIVGGSVTASGAPALQIASTALGVGGIALSSATSTTSTTQGILLDTVTGGPLEINGGTLSDSALEGVRIEDTSAAVALDSVAVSGAGTGGADRSGIRHTGSGALTLTGVTVSGSGDGAGEHAVHIDETSGTVALDGVTLSSSNDTPLRLEQTSAAGAVRVIGSAATPTTITSTAPAGHGVHASAVGVHASLDLTIDDVTVTGGALTGIRVDGGQTSPPTSGTMDTRLVDLTLSGAPFGVVQSFEGTAGGAFVLKGGDITSGDGQAVAIRLDDDSTGTALVQDSTLSRDTAPFGGDVVDLTSEGASVSDTPSLQATIHNTSFQPSPPTSGTPTAGLLAKSRRSAGSMDLRLSDNTLGTFNGAGFEVRSGSTTAGDTASMCLTATGNGDGTVVPDLELRQYSGATFELTEATVGTNAAQIEADLAAANAGGFTAEVNPSNVAYTPNATCTTPAPEGP